VGLDLKGGVAEPKIQPRALNLAQGLVGYFPKIFLRAKTMNAQNKCEQRPRGSYQSDIVNKKFSEQLLGRASHCSLAGSSLKQNILSQK
jgi:hypothetical protein